MFSKKQIHLVLRNIVSISLLQNERKAVTRIIKTQRQILRFNLKFTKQSSQATREILP